MPADYERRGIFICFLGFNRDMGMFRQPLRAEKLKIGTNRQLFRKRERRIQL
jgi:hypothetical protein